MFERLTNKQWPWQQKEGGKFKRYGLCPECDNAMVLVNITNPTPHREAHGRHRLKAVEGFPYNLERILKCDEFEPSKAKELSDLNWELTQEAIDRRNYLVYHFNIAVGLLQEDIGIVISPQFAKQVLQTYFTEGWYRWKTASIGSLPWLFLRGSATFRLYGRKLRPDTDVAKAILSNIEGTMLGPNNQLAGRAGYFIGHEFGVRNHCVTHLPDGRRKETVEFYIVGPAKSDLEPGETVFSKTIELRLEAFERRVVAMRPPEFFGQKLLDAAKEALAKYLEDYPEAQHPTITGLNSSEVGT